MKTIKITSVMKDKMEDMEGKVDRMKDKAKNPKHPLCFYH